MKGLEESRSTATDAISPFATQQSLLRRIALSQTFQRSARLRDLLLDIGEHSLEGQSEDLSEHAIGVRVFGRPENYNSSEDNIVRASVRQVRVKLKDYFETEGAAETMVVDIPKGGYVAVFHPRVTELPAPVIELPAPRKRSLATVLGAVCALLIAAIVILIFRDNSRATAAVDSQNLVSTIFQQNSGPVRFVMTDSVLVILNKISSAPIAIDDYADQSYIDGIKQHAPAGESTELLETLRSRQITSLADVMVLFKMMQLMPSAAKRLEVKHAKHMTARDFKYGNFIVTGSPISNPWATLFDPFLAFQIDPRQSGIRNVSPVGTEPKEFLPRSKDRVDIARVALVKNLSGNGFVLLIAGKNMEGTEGAGEFLLREDSLPLVRKTIGLRTTEPLPSFELVLEVRMIEGTARSTKIVAWRRH